MEETSNRAGMSTGLVIGLMVLIVLILAGGVYAYVNTKTASLTTQISDLKNEVTTLKTVKPKTLTPTPTPTIDETATWKTYTNDEFGFSVKYPSDWSIHDGTAIGKGEVVTLDSSDGNAKVGKNPSDTIIISYYDSIANLDSAWSGSKNAKTIDELITNEGFSKIGTKIVGGISSTEFLEGALGGNNFNVLIPRENHLYLFESIGKDQLTAIENTLISSFQFSAK